MSGDISRSARAAEFWEDVVADMEVTADEYREAGWTALELHPGDVTVMTQSEDDDRYGLNVLLPGDEFEELSTLVDDRGVEFDSYSVYKGMGSGLVFVVVAMESPTDELAVVHPAFYDREDAQDMLATADREGELPIHLRPLSADQYVTFTHEDPSAFFPED